jgi:hypothetical protein
MPTREAIVSTTLPREVEKPIPVRVISTRSGPKPKPAPAAQAAAAVQPNGNQATTAETVPAAAASATTEETVKLGPAASALARKEQAFRQREQAFKAQQAEFAALKEKADKYDQLSQKLSAKDFSEAEKLGLNYEEYTAYKANQAGGEDPNAKKIAALEQQLADLKKGQEETAEDAYEATVNEYRKEVASLVANNPDFSSIKHLGKDAESAVVQLIIDSWEEDEFEMTAEQACRDIENELIESGKKFSALPKLKPAPTEPAESAAQHPPRPSVNTLTNDMQPPTGAPKHEKSLQYLPDSERYAEARRRALAKRAQQQGA